MHTHYNPYEQRPKADLDQFISELGEKEAAIMAAFDELNKFIEASLPDALRHHSSSRSVLNMAMKGVRGRLQNANNFRAQTFDRVWGDTMSDIEQKRAEYFADQKNKERIRREEDASLTTDPETGEVYFMRHMPDGSKRKQIITEEGPFYSRFSSRIGG